MELGETQRFVNNAIEQMKSDQLALFIRWLDEKLSKYRMSNSVSIPAQPILTQKIHHGQRFTCSCGRSFSTEIAIRETNNLETSSPPATPMLVSKIDLKHHQFIQTSPQKRAKTLSKEQTTSMIPTTTINNLIDRINPSVNVVHWHPNGLKSYEDSRELLATESTRTESDIELSSDDSRCLEEIDTVLSPEKGNGSNFIYSNSLWNTALSPSISGCLSSYTTNHQEDPRLQQQQQQQQQRQIGTLKTVSNEPLSPAPLLLQDEQLNKSMIPIHRQPVLIAITHPNVCPNSGPTHFKCTLCHETFDSLLMAQEHINNGACNTDSTGNVLENSDSQMSPCVSPLFDSLQENMEEVLNTRPDSKAVCPICNKVFSSVHTMMRHKTSIHDRQVRYGCNICGRFFFRKDKLTSHMVYHQDFDSYVCCVCSLGFKSRMLMRQHLKRDHFMTNDGKHFNELLAGCQVKKSVHVPSNIPVAAYGASNDRLSMTISKRNISTVLDESDLKPITSD